MGGRSLDTIRAMYDAWNRGDVEGLLEHFTDDAEFRTSGVHPGIGPSYHGRDGLRDFWEQFVGTWQSLTIDLEELVEDGRNALATFRFCGVGREGIELTRPFAHVITMSGGKIARVRGYADHDEARRAFEAAPAGD